MISHYEKFKKFMEIVHNKKTMALFLKFIHQKFPLIPIIYELLKNFHVPKQIH